VPSFSLSLSDRSATCLDPPCPSRPRFLPL
jgi:hypothetical protein